MIFQAYLKATAVQENYRWLPLQHALHFNANSDIINMLFNAHPKAIEVQLSARDLPLHIA